MDRVVHVSTTAVLCLGSFVLGAVFMHNTEAPISDPQVFALRDQLRDYRDRLASKELELLSTRVSMDRLRRQHTDALREGLLPPQHLPTDPIIQE